MNREILCNLCGLSCVIGTIDSPTRRAAGLIEATATGGYESTPGNGWLSYIEKVWYG